jgi:hypothetical protein
MKTGDIVKTVYVYTNDPDHKVVKIIVKAAVIDE